MIKNSVNNLYISDVDDFRTTETNLYWFRSFKLVSNFLVISFL